MATSPATSEPAGAAAREPIHTGRRRPSPEVAAYAGLGVVLAILLWWRVSSVDGFYLDEWLYVHAGQFVTGHLPGGLWEAIPYWTRGPQRLYPTLLGIPYGLFGTSAAFTLAHLFNVLALASSVWPAALLARRVISNPWLRVLGVTLGVAVPWLVIANHMLAENVAFPLFLWACVAILRTVERPTVPNQALAFVALGALTLARVNLGVLFIALAVAVIVGEWLRARHRTGMPWRDRARSAVRRQWLLVAGAVVILIIAVYLLHGGTGTLGDYGRTATASGIGDRLFGDAADATRRTAMTFLRAIVMGGFVLPFALGTGAVLAAAAGRLGERLIVPAWLTIVSVPIVIGGVVLAGAALEERYAFFPVTLIALFAVAALEHLRRLRGWTTAGCVIAVWALLTGGPGPGTASIDFFHAPAGAFWTRVLDARERRWEGHLLGWTSLPQTGWLLFAAGLVVVVLLLRFALERRARLVRGLLIAGLAGCALLQVVAMQYDFKQELNGTSSAPGGIAGLPGRADRLTYLDDAMPDGASALLDPALVRPDSQWAEAEFAEMWSKKIDVVLATPWNGAGTPAAPGHGVLLTSVAPDGLARWTGPISRWLVAAPDDPRMQFDATLVKRSSKSAYAVWRLDPAAKRARWTGSGLGADGSVPTDKPATLTLDTQADPSATSVRLTLLDPGPDPARVTLRGPDGTPRRVRLAAGTPRQVTVQVPSGSADHATWRVQASGTARLIAAHIGQ